MWSCEGETVTLMILDALGAAFLAFGFLSDGTVAFSSLLVFCFFAGRSSVSSVVFSGSIDVSCSPISYLFKIDHMQTNLSCPLADSLTRGQFCHDQSWTTSGDKVAMILALNGRNALERVLHD
jgi:hypothetical protein